MFWDFPIKYNEPVFRPPSEGRSVLIQLTIGCSNNKCTYCNMYRSKTYSERDINKVCNEIDQLSQYYTKRGQYPEKLFLCDGDALGASQESLKIALSRIREKLPQIKRVGIYATAQNMLDKSVDELAELKELGLQICYLGMESGSDKVLHMTVKGNTAQDMIDGCLRVKTAGMKVSVICMLGLGGRKHSLDHIEETARVLSEINPDYLSFLTTMAVEGTPYKRMVDRGSIEMLSVKELLGEMRDILKRSSFNEDVLFRTNHVSNMYPVGGTLPRDTNSIINLLNQWFEETPEGTYPQKPSHM